MTSISLLGCASYLPEAIIDNSFFGEDAKPRKSVMFKGTKLRHHVAPGETSVDMIERATRTLADRLELKTDKAFDIILTNVTCPEMPFTGCGAEVRHRLGSNARWILDLHNGGCVSFLAMVDLARAIMQANEAKTALVCNVQNAAGRLFALPANRRRAQSAVPGDGCGVAFLAASEESPFESIVLRTYGEYAGDMQLVRDNGLKWWEPYAPTPYIDFAEERVASIVSRGNRIVPELMHEAREAAGLVPDQVRWMITNQPNPFFLRNWREAMCMPEEAHIQTFEEHGNLFGAALPICFERGIESGRIQRGHRVLFGGFAHAGDYAAAAVLRWGPVR